MRDNLECESHLKKKKKKEEEDGDEGVAGLVQWRGGRRAGSLEWKAKC